MGLGTTGHEVPRGVSETPTYSTPHLGLVWLCLLTCVDLTKILKNDFLDFSILNEVIKLVDGVS